MFSNLLISEATALIVSCRKAGHMLVTAESCTGGMIATLLTEISGASDVFFGGVVSYANAAKSMFLGVPPALIAAHGAVSEEVARAMAEGALQHSKATLSIAVTGIAGPGGGSTEKPVGLVHIASALRGGATIHQRRMFTGDRRQIRLAITQAAIALLITQAEKSHKPA